MPFWSCQEYIHIHPKSWSWLHIVISSPEQFPTRSSGQLFPSAEGEDDTCLGFNFASVNILCVVQFFNVYICITVLPAVSLAGSEIWSFLEMSAKVYQLSHSEAVVHAYENEAELPKAWVSDMLLHGDSLKYLNLQASLSPVMSNFDWLCPS
jgi:hypothetical protein